MTLPTVISPRARWINPDGTPTIEFYKYILALGSSGGSSGGGGGVTIVITADPYSADNTGQVDSSSAIAKAVETLAQISGGRGGTIYFPDGIYLIGSSVLVQGQGNITFLGASQCSDAIQFPGGATQYGASQIIYSGTPGTACFNVVGEPVPPGATTDGVAFQNLAIVHNSKSTHGILLNQNGGDQQYIYVKGCYLGGGDRAIDIEGTSGYNIYLEETRIGYYQYVADAASELEKFPNYHVYSGLTNGPGIATQWSRCTFRYARINHIYLAGRQFSLELEACTLEASEFQSIVAPLSNGQLTCKHCHWEQIGLGTYWNGTFYQNTSSDTTPVGVIQLGTSTNQGGASQVLIEDCTTSLQVNTASVQSAATVIPLVASWDFSLIEIKEGSHAPNNGFNMGQPYVRRDGSEGRVALVRSQLQPMDGSTLAVGGAVTNMRWVQVDNPPGFGTFPVVQPTDTASYNTNDYAAVKSAVVTGLIRQDQAHSGTPPLPQRREFFAADTGFFTGSDFAKNIPYMKGDTIWFHASFSALSSPGTVGAICLADNVTTYSEPQWAALRGEPFQTFTSPGFGSTIMIDATLGSLFQIYANSNINFTISNPVNPLYPGQRIVIQIKNASGGALGAVTWDTEYKFAGSWTQPVNGANRSIEFFWDSGATTWTQIGEAPSADVNN